jgi:hypothetical protein
VLKHFLILPFLLQPALGAPLTDPTRPDDFGAAASADANSAAPLRLTLIRLGPHPLAVINGANLKPGDRIGGYRLLAVQPGHAVLAGESGRLTLSLVASLRQDPSPRAEGAP